jgi:hypothetical protein
MTELDFTRRTAVIDQFGNRHHLCSQLARGGQGVVYRTADQDLAIKQPLSADGEIDRHSELHERFQSIRCLPFPPRIPIALPLATLRDEPGYVMSLLREMKPFSAFDLDGATRNALAAETIPEWLSGVGDRTTALTLLHYASSGSTKRRLLALAKVAAILARLHAAGLVYGDVSPKNCFMSAGDPADTWLIDADNLRFEVVEGGSSVYTPRYGAPEIVQGLDRSRPRTDCWAFAVMAFEVLSLVHPFVGQKVLEPNDDESGWDAEPVIEGDQVDLDEQAFAGFMPFVDDEVDRSNRALSGLSRELVLTPLIATLFQETFGIGRTTPWRRPAMAFWALELARAYDQSIACPQCEMSYLVDRASCPYCDSPRPAVAIATTGRWQKALQPAGTALELPNRLFYPFSLELNDRTEYEAVVDVRAQSAIHERGTPPLPSGLAFQFLEAGA